jgi:hypothetical protein
MKQEEKPREKCDLKKSPRVNVLLPITFGSYKKLAPITTNIVAKNQIFINHKCVCGALNRQFLVGAVIGCPFSLSLRLAGNFTPPNMSQ